MFSQPPPITAATVKIAPAIKKKKDKKPKQGKFGNSSDDEAESDDSDDKPAASGNSHVTFSGSP